MIQAIDHPVKADIVVIDDALENVQFFIALLNQAGYEVRGFSDGEFGLQSIRVYPPDMILLDVRMPGMDGYQVCEQIKKDEATRDIPVIFLSGLDDTTAKIKGFEVGGVDYVTKPFHPEEVLARVKNHLLLARLRNRLETLVEERTADLQQALAEVQRLKDQLYAENLYLREEINVEYDWGEIVGQSEPLKYVLYRAKKVAPTDTAVLITGETGTGKELIARLIHQHSQRQERPLIKVNCAALPTHLIESELFGHEKGAFTGAVAKRIGRFELADGATLFLDEIGELPLELQPKLLRVLQEGEFERLGSSQTRTANVRLIAATNRDLEAEVRANRFRQDLYYRLNVYPLSVPPLRERPEDIPLLVQACVQKFSKKLGKTIDQISPKTMEALERYAWPGNIRELENVIEQALILTPDTILRVELPKSQPAESDVFQTLEEVERAYIIRVLESKNWRVSGPNGAAVILGMNPFTLRSRMQKLGIKKNA
jgi:DNA-binding NtrC family response regulator